MKFADGKARREGGAGDEVDKEDSGQAVGKSCSGISSSRERKRLDPVI